MSDAVTLTIALPVDGSRDEFQRAIESARADAVARRDAPAVNDLTGLLSLVNEAVGNLQPLAISKGRTRL